MTFPRTHCLTPPALLDTREVGEGAGDGVAPCQGMDRFARSSRLWALPERAARAERESPQKGVYPMDEIVRQISERTGLPADQARAAAEVVLNYLKARLPAPVAAQIDAVLSGITSDTISQAQQALGGLFGQKE